VDLADSSKILDVLQWMIPQTMLVVVVLARPGGHLFCQALLERRLGVCEGDVYSVKLCVIAAGDIVFSRSVVMDCGVCECCTIPEQQDVV